MCDVLASSNWKVINGGELKNLIIVSSKERKDSFIDVISSESCKCLVQLPEDTTNSKPEISISMTNVMKQIDIFSEGSLVEVFGMHNDYLFTCDCSFVDDWEGFAVYHAKIVLPRLSQCKLKFSRIKNTEKFWIYSIQILTEEFDSNNHLLFNFENVQQLLDGTNKQVLERAEKFKNFLTTYKKNSVKSNSMKMLESLLELNSLCDNSKCVNKLENSSFSQSQADDSSSFMKENSKKNTSITLLSTDIEYLKCYIDKEIGDAKADIVRHINLKMDELKVDFNTKLKKIINILEETHTKKEHNDKSCQEQ